MCQMRTDLDAVAEKKCLKKHGLWRKVPFSAEIFDDKKEMVMNNDNGELTAVESNKINRTWKCLDLSRPRGGRGGSSKARSA